MTQFYIQRASLEMVPVLAAMHARCFTEIWDAQAISLLLATPGAFALVAVERSEVVAVGFLLARAAGGEAEVLSIGVLPEHRGAGAADALLREGAAQMALRGATACFLEVACDNGPAIGLYRRFGFLQVGQRKAYYRTPAGGIDAVIMRYDLSGNPVEAR